MIENFIRFFDKTGSDMNLAPVSNSIRSLYNGAKVNYESLVGKLFFPEISVGLIESQNLYMLQEVTGPSEFQLRKLPGKVTTVAGNSTITGLNTRFSDLNPGDQVKIHGTIFTIVTVVSDTELILNIPTSFSVTTGDFYYKDFITYSELRSSPGTFQERVNVKFPEREVGIRESFTEQPFFIYEVDYSEDLPYIQKGLVASYNLVNGANDLLDTSTGRVELSTVNTTPLQINIGISSNTEFIYENKLEINREKEYRFEVTQPPTSSSDSIIFTVNGTDLPFYDVSEVKLIGSSTLKGIDTSTSSFTPTNCLLSGTTGSFIISSSPWDLKNFIDKNDSLFLDGNWYEVDEVGEQPSGNFFIRIKTPLLTTFTSQQGKIAGPSIFKKKLKILSVNLTGSDTEITVEQFDNPVSSINFDSFLISVVNTFKLADLDLYGEVVGEDERLKLVLQNFGKKIDYDKEYIFRESDISEELPDYKILNKKRKELLLEGDNIYPYLGSYRALINIINYFGYYDLRIKEYFLNVDEDSSNFGNYMHVLVPKDEKQRKQVKEAWRSLPSKIYKKTSLFGLFYDLNKTTENVDIFGIPEVVDAFDFSAEEVLIKLFGLKELLKREYLPLNARIYDITGEGIYFQRIAINTWSDNLHHLVLDLGKRPQFEIYPTESYINDVRRIDSYYIENFVSNQGLTGFMNLPSNDPLAKLPLFNNPVSSIFNNQLVSYDDYPNEVFDNEGNLLPVLDTSWEFMPPGINNPSFNEIASRLIPLPDHENILSGAPVLLESFFDITWADSLFNWSQLSIMGPTGSPLNINLWTWETIGRGEYIDMRWTVEKHGENGFFYDTGRRPIDSFSVNVNGKNRILHPLLLPYEGDYDIALYNYDITNNYTVEFQRRTVNTKKANFVSVHKKETIERKWKEFDNISWKDTTGPWYYPLHIKSPTWKDSKISWGSLDFSKYKDQSLFRFNLDTSLSFIDREAPNVLLSGDQTGDLPNSLKMEVGNFLFFTRKDADPVKVNLELPPDSLDVFLKGLIGTVESNALVSGVMGTNTISTLLHDTTSYISPDDSIWVDNNWYQVDSVDSTSITIKEALLTSFTSLNALTYGSNREVLTTFFGSFSEMKRFSRVLLTTNCDYLSLDPSVDFYEYVNSLEVLSGEFSFTEKDEVLRKIIEQNSSLINNNTLYASWGLFSGTYAVEISNFLLQNQSTLVRLKDPDKELYYLDGNFNVEISNYDVDYAETRIGVEGLKFGNATEYTWDENPSQTWQSLEFHSGNLCGFTIPFVAPGGSITIDEEPSFFFSGNVNIDSTKQGLQVALQELRDSVNSGLLKYDFDILPDDDIHLIDSNSNELQFINNLAQGATFGDLSGIPSKGSLKIPAEISVVLSGGSIVSVNIDNPGYGYNSSPIVEILPEPCGGTAAEITLLMSGLPFEGTVIGATWSGGSGYSSQVEVNVQPPQGYRDGDNYAWTGKEWVEIERVIGNTLVFSTPLTLPVESGSFPLLPYQYHKQIFFNPSIMQQFYHFIHAKAKNPSSEMLSYVNLGNGVESEWSAHPDRTYTYPLRNSILFSSLGEDLEYDHLYEKWVYEGSDYPPLTINPAYASDLLSVESRLPFSSVLQPPFTFIDTIISDSQQVVLQNSVVMFNYDDCKVPGKNSPIWTIVNEDDNKVQVVSDSTNLMWNFTKSGNFTVNLKLLDSNGNISEGKKASFIVVKEYKETIV